MGPVESVPEGLARGATNELHIHVPTPGDHYSAATGSAIMTIIHELARAHARRGGRTQVVVGRGTRHDYPVGDCIEVAFRGLPSSREKALDAGLGLLGMPRPFAEALYRPSLVAIDPGFGGPVFVHNNAAPVTLFARRRPAAQVCLYVNNVLFRTFSRRELRRVIAAAHRVICVSDFIAADLTRRLGRPGANIRVVHNGADVERFRPRADGPPAGDPLVLFVGRVVPEKGADLLLRAAARILGPQRRFKVRIIGSSGFAARDPLSPYERELRRIAEPMNGAVEFRPFVDRERILAEYHAASIFCVPSNWDDPCPLTIAEGLACGLPTVASRRGGIPEVAGQAALLFDPPDVDALAERLAYLIDDPSARVELGRQARARAEAFSWERQYLQLCDAVAGA